MDVYTRRVASLPERDSGPHVAQRDTTEAYYCGPADQRTMPDSPDAAPEQDSPPDAAPEQDSPTEAAPEQDSPPDVAPEQDSPPDVAPEQDSPPDAAPEQDSPPDAAPEQDSPTEAQKEEEARLFLQNQGIVSVMALASLGAFVYFPNAYVAVGCVLLISVVAKYLEKAAESRIAMRLDNKAVLVTGCDSGIGEALARQLASLGVSVYAGCLDAAGEGAAGLRQLGVTVVQLDVSSREEVQTALQLVREKTGDMGLFALVNNAGVYCIGDAEFTPIEQYERLVNVNQLGLVRVTQAFLPLVRRKRGRIVTVTGLEGRLSVIYQAAYNMSKHAAEAFTNTLRMEVARFGVKVITIEPGNYRAATDALNPGRLADDSDTMWKRMSPELRQTYGREYVQHHLAAAEHTVRTSCRQVSRVTDRIVQALFTEKPNTRYVVGGSDHWYDMYKLRLLYSCLVPDWFLDGLFTFDTRGYPNPKSLIGQGHGHSH